MSAHVDSTGFFNQKMIDSTAFQWAKHFRRCIGLYKKKVLAAASKSTTVGKRDNTTSGSSWWPSGKFNLAGPQTCWLTHSAAFSNMARHVLAILMTKLHCLCVISSRRDSRNLRLFLGVMYHIRPDGAWKRVVRWCHFENLQRNRHC